MQKNLIKACFSVCWFGQLHIQSPYHTVCGAMGLVSCTSSHRILLYVAPWHLHHRGHLCCLHLTDLQGSLLLFFSLPAWPAAKGNVTLMAVLDYRCHTSCSLLPALPSSLVILPLYLPFMFTLSCSAACVICCKAQSGWPGTAAACHLSQLSVRTPRGLLSRIADERERERESTLGTWVRRKCPETPARISTVLPNSSIC